MKLYNNDYLDEFSKGKDKDIKIIREEGRENGECMSGYFSTIYHQMLSILLWVKKSM
jgi:hypothetical protein